MPQVGKVSMLHETLQVGGTNVLLRGEAGAPVCLVQMTFEHACERIDEQVAAITELAAGQPFCFAGVVVHDANAAFSPWPAPAVFRHGEDFGGQAKAALTQLLDSMLPAIEQACDLPECCKLVLGGYSLAGLFSLWAGYRTDRFAAIAAASPSVWFPGWNEFAEGHEMLAQSVFLSHGTAERKTRNRQLATVRNCIEHTHELLATQLGAEHCELAWSPGDHFQDADGRMARSFAWALGQAAGSQ